MLYLLPSFDLLNLMSHLVTISRTIKIENTISIHVRDHRLDSWFIFWVMVDLWMRTKSVEDEIPTDSELQSRTRCIEPSQPPLARHCIEHMTGTLPLYKICSIIHFGHCLLFNRVWKDLSFKKMKPHIKTSRKTLVWMKIINFFLICQE